MQLGNKIWLLIFKLSSAFYLSLFFCLHDRKSRDKNLNILRLKRAFRLKQKHFKCFRAYSVKGSTELGERLSLSICCNVPMGLT